MNSEAPYFCTWLLLPGEDLLRHDRRISSEDGVCCDQQRVDAGNRLPQVSSRVSHVEVGDDARSLPALGDSDALSVVFMWFEGLSPVRRVQYGGVFLGQGSVLVVGSLRRGVPGVG